MHMIIRCICYGTDKEEAFDKAKQIFENLCGEEGQPFDYFSTFDDEKSIVSGKARWGDKPVIALASSKDGKKLIDEGMKHTKLEFMSNLKLVRDALSSFTDEELYEEEIKDVKSKVVNKLKGDKSAEFNLLQFRYSSHCLGQYRGSGIFLYDNDGEGIHNTKHLKDALSKWNNSKDYEGMEIYVVPADVHC